MISRRTHLALKISRECFIIEGILKRLGDLKPPANSTQTQENEESPIDQVCERFPELERIAHLYFLAAHPSLQKIVMQPVNSCFVNGDILGASKLYKSALVKLVKQLDKWSSINEAKRLKSLKKFYGKTAGAERLSSEMDSTMMKFANHMPEFVEYLCSTDDPKSVGDAMKE